MTSLEESLISLTTEANDLYIPYEVQRLSLPPSPIHFLRNYVMSNIPVVIENGCSKWPAITKWTNEYLSKVLGEKMVTVALTPNGYADAPMNGYFVLPDEREMTFNEFLEILKNNKGDVAYIQKQNSSFTDEFKELIGDAATDISWASEAFDKQPDAINFWMGSERSVTSMHKDHYENIYAVVKGTKTFILQAPTDLPCIPYKQYPVARYKKDKNGCYQIVEERNTCEHCEMTLKVISSSIDQKFDKELTLNERQQCNDHPITSNNSIDLSCNNITMTGGPMDSFCKSNTADKDSIDPLYENSTRDSFDTFCGNNTTTKDSIGLFCKSDILNESNNKTHQTKESEDIFINNSKEKQTEHCGHESTKIPWIAIDPLSPDFNKYPLYKHTRQLKVTLYPGDLLYLPSLWFHHVQQSNNTIAVNFWYDMEYDIKYNYYKFVEGLKEKSYK